MVLVGQATSTTESEAPSQAGCRNNDAECGEDSLTQVYYDFSADVAPDSLFIFTHGGFRHRVGDHTAAHGGRTSSARGISMRCGVEGSVYCTLFRMSGTDMPFLLNDCAITRDVCKGSMIFLVSFSSFITNGSSMHYTHPCSSFAFVFASLVFLIFDFL